MEAWDSPSRWQRKGLVVARDEAGGVCSVAGNPCIVWDDEIPGWRMVLFFNPPGHAQAICRSLDDVGPGRWELVAPLEFTNPEDLGGALHAQALHRHGCPSPEPRRTD